jgi:hypothetical protein
MVKDEKNIVREKQLPGQKFSSGNLTLFQIAESKGKQLGHPQTSYSDAQVSDRDKEILEKAIPADRVESIIRAKGKQKEKLSSKIKRGMIMQHIPTGEKVTIMATDVDTNTRGHIRHEVCIVGTTKKFKVPEKNLKVISNGKA